MLRLQNRHRPRGDGSRAPPFDRHCRSDLHSDSGERLVGAARPPSFSSHRHEDGRRADPGSPSQDQGHGLWISPVGLGVRALWRRSRPPGAWGDGSCLLGTDRWIRRLHRVWPRTQHPRRHRSAGQALRKAIGPDLDRALKSVSPEVATRPGALRPRGNPLFVVCFATGSTAVRRVALRLATAISDGLDRALADQNSNDTSTALQPASLRPARAHSSPARRPSCDSRSAHRHVVW